MEEVLCVVHHQQLRRIGRIARGPALHSLEVDEFVAIALHDQPRAVRPRDRLRDEASDRRRNGDELARSGARRRVQGDRCAE